jgi:mono/diheme cytochrome c family protein
MMRTTAVLFALTLPLGVIAQQAAPGDLVLQARAILHKHCSACHGGPGGKGEITVFHRAGLDRPSRPFLQLSQILELIEDGSMPPGNRPPVPEADRRILRKWVEAGAGAYVQKYDDEYVLRTQLADVQKQSAEAIPFVRYISLTHLLTDDGSPLEPRREAMKKALNSVAKGDEKLLQPLDPAATVFRFDIRAAGWNERRFDEMKEVNEKEVRIPQPWNLFDAVLLEYPHGHYFDDQQAFEELRTAFLKPAAQIRPIAFLRGDWVADFLPHLPIAAELRSIVGKPAKARERTPPLQLLITAKRTPMLPFDALSQASVELVPPPFKVTYFETIDTKTKEAKKQFKIGESFTIHMHASQDIFVEIALTDSKGDTDLLPMQKVDRNVPAYIRPEGADGFAIPESTPLGTSTLTFFAAEAKFQAGTVLKGRGLADRVLHGFFELDKPLAGFDPMKMIKRTIEIEIVK